MVSCMEGVSLCARRRRNLKLQVLQIGKVLADHFYIALILVPTAVIVLWNQLLGHLFAF